MKCFSCGSKEAGLECKLTMGIVCSAIVAGILVILIISFALISRLVESNL